MVAGGARHGAPVVTAAIVALIGLFLAIGGLWLAVLGGSWYFALCGGAMIAAAKLLAKGSHWGLRTYWIILGLTIAWALREVGLQGWSLAPRIACPIVLGLWLCTPWVRRGLDLPTPDLINLRLTPWLATAAALPLLPLMGTTYSSDSAPDRLALDLDSSRIEWRHVGGTLSGTRFAKTDQIGPGNVSALEVTWRFGTGEAGPTFEATPLVVNDTLYLCTAKNIVIALDPETGAERWRHDPEVDAALHMNVVCRGVSYHEQPAAMGVCARRVIFSTLDARLIALDAETGAKCQDFGQNGSISLMEGIGPHPRGFYYSTSPPTIVSDRVVVGALVMDNQTTMAPSGVIRAFDARTGALSWAWDMGAPERTGAPAKGHTYTPGTPNAWGTFSADAQLGLVYVPLGNPSPDFWGGARRSFDEKYGSSVVALDIATGRPRWSFQTTHHDLWDYDVPAQPVLVDLPIDGDLRPALVQATKRGEIFVLDRRTGEPIFPVEERSVPQTGSAPGERISPTQPFSAISLQPPDLTESDMWGLTPIDHLLCRIRFRSMRYEGIFAPPGLTGSLKYPGATGVINWGGVTIDEDRSLLVAFVDQLHPRQRAPKRSRQITDSRAYNWGPQENTPYVIHTRPFQTRAKIPCTAPPWGRINAIDLKTGRLLWSRPLGTARDSGPFDIPSHLPLEMGPPNMGGAISTRSGLTLVGATVDRYLRAFNSTTGEELWRGRLPAAGHSTPVTYVSERSGRQFVVVAAGGHAALGSRVSDQVVAFALPEPKIHRGPAKTTQGASGDHGFRE